MGVVAPGGFDGLPPQVVASGRTVVEARGGTETRSDGSPTGGTLLRLLLVHGPARDWETGFAVEGRVLDPSALVHGWIRRDLDLGAWQFSGALGGDFDGATGRLRPAGTIRAGVGPLSADLGLSGSPAGSLEPSVILGGWMPFDEGFFRLEGTWKAQHASAGSLLGLRAGLSWQMGPGPLAGVSLGAEWPDDDEGAWRLLPRLQLAW